MGFAARGSASILSQWKLPGKPGTATGAMWEGPVGRGGHPLARPNLKRNFGHGGDSLASVLATPNVFAFTLHSVLDRLSDLWRQCRDKAGAWDRFFEKLRSRAESVFFPD